MAYLSLCFGTFLSFVYPFLLYAKPGEVLHRSRLPDYSQSVLGVQKIQLKFLCNILICKGQTSFGRVSSCSFICPSWNLQSASRNKLNKENNIKSRRLKRDTLQQGDKQNASNWEHQYNTSTPHSFDDSSKTGLFENGQITMETQPRWSKIMDEAQLALTVVGVVANLLTLTVLLKNGSHFNATILLLLRHQTFIDALACLFGCLLMAFPNMWLVGHHGLDLVICHAWHGQSIYWGVLWVSIGNLVVISVERFLAVCKPFSHKYFTTRKGVFVIIGLYFLSLVCTSGANLNTQLNNGTCIGQQLLTGDIGERIMVGFAISTFFTFWLIPCTLFAIFYGLIVVSLHRRVKQSHLAASRVIDSASTELTRTAITVTVIFFVALGFDIIYYLLGKTGVVVYVNNSPLQKIGVLFSVLNSVANPFVYALLMPAYRQSLLKTFGCKGCAKKPSTEPNEASSSTDIILPAKVVHI